MQPTTYSSAAATPMTTKERCMHNCGILLDAARQTMVAQLGSTVRPWIALHSLDPRRIINLKTGFYLLVEGPPFTRAWKGWLPVFFASLRPEMHWFKLPPDFQNAKVRMACRLHPPRFLDGLCLKVSSVMYPASSLAAQTRCQRNLFRIHPLSTRGRSFPGPGFAESSKSKKPGDEGVSKENCFHKPGSVSMIGRG